jgi:hypothetical protein
MKWENLTLKGALAFFLVCTSAFMVVLWMLHPPSGDASQIGLLAGFVTLFIKMAADAIGYQFNSSSGSDKKDETQAKVAGALADKVAPVVPPPPANGTPWWNRMTDAERAAITAAAGVEPIDPKLTAIVSGPVKMKPDPEEMSYLVSKNLLTSERAVAIQAS